MTITGMYYDEIAHWVEAQVEVSDEEAERLGATEAAFYSLEDRPMAQAHFTIAKDGTVTQNYDLSPTVSPAVRARLAEVLERGY